MYMQTRIFVLCICIRVCMYMYITLCVHTCKCGCMSMSVCMSSFQNTECVSFSLSMCVCVYIYIYIHIYTYVFLYTFVHVHEHIHVWIYMNVCKCVYIHILHADTIRVISSLKASRNQNVKHHEGREHNVVLPTKIIFVLRTEGKLMAAYTWYSSHADHSYTMIVYTYVVHEYKHAHIHHIIEEACTYRLLEHRPSRKYPIHVFDQLTNLPGDVDEKRSASVC